MLDERRFTRSLARFFGTERDVIVGIGDDAAVVRNRGRAQVLCCDPVVEHVHFTTGTAAVRIGRKAVNRNLADLAAMGAEADWLLVSLLLPRGFPARRRTQLLRGIRSAAAAAGARVVGGDVATTSGPLVVTVTAIGHVEARVMERSGARAGDTLHTSGPLGGSLAGHHLDFEPPLAIGRWLAAQPAVHAAIDVSDGLLLDLATMLRASGGLGAELDADAIPISRAAHRRARGSAKRALLAALGDGEDHVLLWSQAARALPQSGPLSAVARRPIGRVLARSGLWLRSGAQRVSLPELGYRHELASKTVPAR